MAPKDTCVLMLIAVNVNLDGKRDFADAIKLRTLRWGGYYELSLWILNVITRVLLRGRGRKRFDCRRGGGDAMMEASGWGDARKTCRRHRELERQGFSPKASRRNTFC